MNFPWCVQGSSHAGIFRSCWRSEWICCIAPYPRRPCLATGRRKWLCRSCHRMGLPSSGNQKGSCTLDLCTVLISLSAIVPLWVPAPCSLCAVSGLLLANGAGVDDADAALEPWPVVHLSCVLELAGTVLVILMSGVMSCPCPSQVLFPTIHPPNRSRLLRLN